eukprot:Skav223318  [mRNA]  locus=scaffold200:48559:50988:+ [translate_table: standard]
MEIGTQVFVKGKGRGIVALNNEDGTWNVEFDDDGAEGDFREEARHQGDLLTLEDLVSHWSPAGARLVPAPWSQVRPEGWTRFVCFSDTHGLHQLIPKEHMPPADVLLHAGDFTNTGELEQIECFNAWLEAYPAEQKVVEVRGYKIYGSPWQPEFCDWAFNLPRGEELREKWAAIPADTDLLLVHGPPAGQVDMTSKSGRVGCKDLLEAIQQRTISVVVAGHLHSAYGTSADEVSGH